LVNSNFPRASRMQEDSWILASFLFCEYMDLKSAKSITRKKRTWPISSHLDLTRGQ